VLDRLLADPRLPAPIEPAWAQPGRWHGRPTAASTVRADPVTLQRGPHLFAVQVARPVGDPGQRLRWSVWRRRHQARAPTCHDRPQAAWQIVKITIYGWSTNLSISWWRRACGPGPANGGGIP
jgi:hypothetical protein